MQHTGNQRLVREPFFQRSALKCLQVATRDTYVDPFVFLERFFRCLRQVLPTIGVQV